GQKPGATAAGYRASSAHLLATTPTRFNRPLGSYRPASPAGGMRRFPPMLALARAAVAAATFILFSVTSFAAEKAFQRPELDDAAIKLEAQIKAEAGQVAKSPAVLRREADAAFARKDFRTGMQLLGQLISVTPQDSAAWLQLAKAVLQIRPGNDSERTLLL